MNRELFLEIEGGVASPDALPAVISRDLYSRLSPSVEAAEYFYTQYLTQIGRPMAVTVRSVDSTSMTCAVRSHPDETATVVVPLGVWARLRVMSRLLLRYWENPAHVAMIQSPLDKFPEQAWKVPEKLEPLLRDYPSGDKARFWGDLKALDDMIELDPRAEPDVVELLHLGLFHIMTHEFAHLAMDHSRLLAAENLAELGVKHGLTLLDIKKSVEVQADAVGSAIAMNLHVGHILGLPGTDKGWLGRMFLRLSYITTLIYNLYNPQRKYLGSYAENIYTHPLVRRQVFVLASTLALEGESREMIESWQANEIKGWTEASWALNDLNLESMAGRFGEVDLNSKDMYFPIHINPGGTVTARYLDRMVARSLDTLRRFLDLHREITGIEGPSVPIALIPEEWKDEPDLPDHPDLNGPDGLPDPEKMRQFFRESLRRAHDEGGQPARPGRQKLG